MKQFLLISFLATVLCLANTQFVFAVPPSVESTPAINNKVKQAGHDKEISLFVLSKDGRIGLSCDQDENNYIWDMKSGALIREIGKPEAIHIPVVAATFSPESSQLIWARTSKIMPVLWDVESGRRLGVLSSKEKGHSANIVSITFSPDGRYIATGDSQGTVVIWNRADRSVLRRINAHVGEVKHLLFLAGRNELATAGKDGAIRLLGITGTEETATLSAPSEFAITSLTGSTDGQFIYASSENMTVKGWNVSMRTLRGTLDLKNRQINSIALSPDGDFMAFAEEDNSVLLWSIRESKEAWRNDLDSSATKVIFSPDGKRLYSSGGDNWIREWEVATGHMIKKIGGITE